MINKHIGLELHFGEGRLMVDVAVENGAGILRIQELYDALPSGKTITGTPVTVGKPIDLIFSNQKSLDVLLEGLLFIRNGIGK